MPEDEPTKVTVSRRIAAAPALIFRVLADPARHVEIDGSGMLRGSITDSLVSGVGDVFAMKMHHESLGDYEMDNLVVEYEPDRRVTWEPERRDKQGEHWHNRWGFHLEPDGHGATIVTETYDCSRSPQEARERLKDGEIRLEAMAITLERLDRLCTDEDRAAGATWEKEIGAITLFVEDLAQAKAFYGDVFRVPLVFEDANSAAFKLAGTMVNLLVVPAADDLIAPAEVAGAGSGSRFQLSIFVEDVDAVCEELGARGVELVNGPMDRPWGMRTACFADSGGHLWEVAQELGGDA